MKYKCPYCGKDSFSLIKKTIAGGMASKGQACPECGRHAVHGLKSTIFRTVAVGIVLVILLVNYFKDFMSPLASLILLVAVNLFCMIINGLFFDLEENNRKDIK